MPATSSVQLPDFLGLTRTSGLTLRTNRHCYAVSAASEAWFLAMEHQNPRVPGDSLESDHTAALKGLKIGLWAAVCFPACDPPQLRLATDFLMVIGVCASKPSCARSTSECGWTAVSDLFPCIVPKILSAMPSESSKQRFSASFEAFRAAHVRFLALRENSMGAPPTISVEEYVELRRDLSGARMLFDLIELAEGLKMTSDEVNSDFTDLRHYAADVISLSTDVFAYNNEQSIGNPLNIISLLRREKGVSVQGAINLVFGRIQQACKDFVAAAATLRAQSAPCTQTATKSGWTWNPLSRIASTTQAAAVPAIAMSSDAQSYLNGLEDCVVGTLNWCYETELYFGSKGDEVRQYGWVFLKPESSNDDASREAEG